MSEVLCSFINKCQNYQKECHRCEFNAAIKLGNYLLLLGDEGKTVKYLEKKLDG